MLLRAMSPAGLTFQQGAVCPRACIDPTDPWHTKEQVCVFMNHE